MRTRKRAAAIAAALLSVTGIATVATSSTPAFASTTVTGSVTCVDGRAVEGIFVHANSGGGGWATMSVPGNTSNYVSWHYTLPNGGSYYLDVGCGGNTSSWASDNYSANYTGNSIGLLCYDTKHEVPANQQYRCS